MDPRFHLSNAQALVESLIQEGSEFLRKRARQAREQAENWAERGRDMYNAQKEQIRSAVDAGRQAYREKTGVSSDDGENV